MKRHDPADVAACARFEKITRCYQLLSAVGAEPDGASWTGAPLDGRFGADAGGGFLAATCACGDAGGGAAAAGGRGAAGNAGAAAADDDGFGAAPSGGSDVMMLTGGVDAEVGKSALVGLPVGTDAGSAAIMPLAACGAFHDDA
jgi:hypothetical protein